MEEKQRGKSSRNNPVEDNSTGKDALRLFVSLPLPEEVKQALLEVQQFLSPSFFRPLPKENFHLTLAFLGDTRVTYIPMLERILDETAGATPLFPCELSGLGAFPHPWEPRVVWVGIDVGSKEAGILSDTLRARLQEAKVSFDTKPFRPHITIAYARKNLSRQELREAGGEFSKLLRHIGEEKHKMGLSKQTVSLDQSGYKPQHDDGGRGEPFAAFPRLQFRAEEVALVKSVLRLEGAVHTPIHIARLQEG